ncbi:oxidoreductase [Rhodococcus opacus]|uniref:oxidoreductase n=1 Tax=Rhodococcus opacus TaxID=37919 RepID=UPI001FF443E1|nr:oxidoreductase [Rhodococcus opacus]UOT06777.1 oxidoreductase [Rhodococcus opacus]
MQRSVQYWRLVKTDGSALDGLFPAERVVRALRGASSKGFDRHRQCRDGMVLIAHGLRENPPMLILDKVRHENLPSIGDGSGTRRAIGLSADEGLLEPTYCMFANDNIVAMLMSGNGPRAKRLCDYLKAKLGVEVGLDPILRRDLDRVLDEMRVSSVDVAVPAARINRDLVGGDWAEALEANRVLAQDGVVKVGVAVGRRGTRDQKDRRRFHIRELIDQLRGSGAISEMQSARVTGTIRGSQRSVDLFADHFVERTEVDADRLANPERSASYAHSVLEQSLADNASYLSEVVPRIVGTSNDLNPRFVELPDDERNR